MHWTALPNYPTENGNRAGGWEIDDFVFPIYHLFPIILLLVASSMMIVWPNCQLSKTKVSAGFFVSVLAQVSLSCPVSTWTLGLNTQLPELEVCTTALGTKVFFNYMMPFSIHEMSKRWHLQGTLPHSCPSMDLHYFNSSSKIRFSMSLCTKLLLAVRSCISEI